MEEQKQISTVEMAREIAFFLEENFAEGIVLMDMRTLVYFTDYFILCNASSERLLRSLSSDLVREVRSRHGLHAKPEGKPESGWVVVDLGDIVVHLFSEEKRQFYRLEDLWKEGQVLLRIQ